MANTIADKLTYLSGTKDAIKQSIIAKGVEVTDTDTFRSYADKITSIQTGGGGGTGSLVTGTKLAYSTFSTIPDEYISYLEQQTDLSFMFSDCRNLKTIPLFSTNRAIDMEYMFFACTSLTTVPQFDTRNVNNMSGMFTACESLTSVPQFDTRNVTDMSSMFSNCTSLTTVPQFDTRNVNNMEESFIYCTSLTSVPLLNFSNVTITDGIFGECSSLTNLGGFTGLKTDLDLSNCLKLTVDSVMNVINYAADMTSEPKTLTLHQDAFNKLSEEQIATATSKGWNIAAA